jgi:hypothetical protein
VLISFVNNQFVLAVNKHKSLYIETQNHEELLWKLCLLLSEEHFFFFLYISVYLAESCLSNIFLLYWLLLALLWSFISIFGGQIYCVDKRCLEALI